MPSLQLRYEKRPVGAGESLAWFPLEVARGDDT